MTLIACNYIIRLEIIIRSERSALRKKWHYPRHFFSQRRLIRCYRGVADDFFVKKEECDNDELLY